MNDRSREDRIHADIGSVEGSQVAIGSRIRQEQTIISREPPTPAELEELRQMLARLKAQVATDAPADQQQAAVAKVEELEEAVTQPKPDLDTMASVRHWFVRRLPALAGAVTSVIVNPIVGKLVGAAGDALSAEFSRRFGAGSKEK